MQTRRVNTEAALSLVWIVGYLWTWTVISRLEWCQSWCLYRPKQPFMRGGHSVCSDLFVLLACTVSLCGCWLTWSHHTLTVLSWFLLWGCRSCWEQEARCLQVSPSPPFSSHHITFSLDLLCCVQPPLCLHHALSVFPSSFFSASLLVSQVSFGSNARTPRLSQPHPGTQCWRHCDRCHWWVQGGWKQHSGALFIYFDVFLTLYPWG